MAEVLEVNDIGELANHRLTVTRLLEGTPRASFFHTVDWLQTWWRNADTVEKLRFLMVRAAGHAIGVMPLVVQTRASRLGPLRVLTYPAALAGADSASNCSGPIGPNQTATLTMALRHLSTTPRDWDLLDLPGIDHQGADRGRTFRALQRVGWRASATPDGNRYPIELPTGPATPQAVRYQAFLATHAENVRQELTKARQQLAAAGQVEFLRYRPEALRNGGGDPRWDLYDACESLFANEEAPSSSARLLRDTHPVAARQGAVDLCLLKLNGRPIACSYGYHDDGDVRVLRTGHDAACLPSKVVNLALLDLMIEDSCRRGDRRMDRNADMIGDARCLPTKIESVWRISYAPARSLRGNVAALHQQLAHRWASRVG